MYYLGACQKGEPVQMQSKDGELEHRPVPQGHHQAKAAVRDYMATFARRPRISGGKQSSGSVGGFYTAPTRQNYSPSSDESQQLENSQNTGPYVRPQTSAKPVLGSNVHDPKEHHQPFRAGKSISGEPKRPGSAGAKTSYHSGLSGQRPTNSLKATLGVVHADYENMTIANNRAARRTQIEKTTERLAGGGGRSTAGVPLGERVARFLQDHGDQPSVVAQRALDFGSGEKLHIPKTNKRLPRYLLDARKRRVEKEKREKETGDGDGPMASPRPRRRPGNTATASRGIDSGFVMNLREKMHRTTGGSTVNAKRQASSRFVGSPRPQKVHSASAMATSSQGIPDALPPAAEETEDNEDGTQAAPAGAFLKAKRCGLCELEFAIDLPARITYKSVIALRERWEDAHNSALHQQQHEKNNRRRGPTQPGAGFVDRSGSPLSNHSAPPSDVSQSQAPASGKMRCSAAPSLLYKSVCICRMCAQFFGVYLGERFEGGVDHSLGDGLFNAGEPKPRTVGPQFTARSNSSSSEASYSSDKSTPRSNGSKSSSRRSYDSDYSDDIVTPRSPSPTKASTSAATKKIEKSVPKEAPKQHRSRSRNSYDSSSGGTSARSRSSSLGYRSRSSGSRRSRDSRSSRSRSRSEDSIPPKRAPNKSGAKKSPPARTSASRAAGKNISSRRPRKDAAAPIAGPPQKKSYYVVHDAVIGDDDVEVNTKLDLDAALAERQRQRKIAEAKLRRQRQEKQTIREANRGKKSSSGTRNGPTNIAKERTQTIQERKQEESKHVASDVRIYASRTLVIAAPSGSESYTQLPPLLGTAVEGIVAAHDQRLREAHTDDETELRQAQSLFPLLGAAEDTTTTGSATTTVLTGAEATKVNVLEWVRKIHIEGKELEAAHEGAAGDLLATPVIWRHIIFVGYCSRLHGAGVGDVGLVLAPRANGVSSNLGLKELLGLCPHSSIFLDCAIPLNYAMPPLARSVVFTPSRQQQFGAMFHHLLTSASTVSRNLVLHHGSEGESKDREQDGGPEENLAQAFESSLFWISHGAPTDKGGEDGDDSASGPKIWSSTFQEECVIKRPLSLAQTVSWCVIPIPPLPSPVTVPEEMATTAGSNSLWSLFRRMQPEADLGELLEGKKVLQLDSAAPPLLLHTGGEAEDAENQNGEKIILIGGTLQASHAYVSATRLGEMMAAMQKGARKQVAKWNKKKIEEKAQGETQDDGEGEEEEVDPVLALCTAPSITRWYVGAEGYSHSFTLGLTVSDSALTAEAVDWIQSDLMPAMQSSFPTQVDVSLGPVAGVKIGDIPVELLPVHASGQRPSVVSLCVVKAALEEEGVESLETEFEVALGAPAPPPEPKTRRAVSPKKPSPSPNKSQPKPGAQQAASKGEYDDEEDDFEDDDDG